MLLITFVLFAVLSSVLPQEVANNQNDLPNSSPSQEYQAGISRKPCRKAKIIAKFLSDNGIPHSLTRNAPTEEETNVLPSAREEKEQPLLLSGEPKSSTTQTIDTIDNDNRRSNKGGSVELEKENSDKVECDPSGPSRCVPLTDLSPSNTQTALSSGYKTEAQIIEAKTIELFEDCLKDKIKRIMRGENESANTRRTLGLPSGSDESEESEESVEISPRYRDPTQGSAVQSFAQSKVNLMQNPRICFACSTATNPTCWLPNRRTTVKYCNRNHNACVTKTFGTGASLTLIRDCANTCEDTTVPGIAPKYKSCSLCHSDLCNSAYSINKYNLLIILLISFVKCTFF